ncbi:hypothetical protein L7F22_059094 [Adiantum nelumboides]|nr:hypothetical protein [Adiantum nelumboides]
MFKSLSSKLGDKSFAKISGAITTSLSNFFSQSTSCFCMQVNIRLLTCALLVLVFGNSVTFLLAAWVAKRVGNQSWLDINSYIKFLHRRVIRVDSIVELQTQHVTDWPEFKKELKEEYFLEDSQRVMKQSFMKWINKKNKGLSTHELLQEYEKKYEQLSSAEQRSIRSERVELLIKAADVKLQKSLVQLLEDATGHDNPIDDMLSRARYEDEEEMMTSNDDVGLKFYTSSHLHASCNTLVRVFEVHKFTVDGGKSQPSGGVLYTSTDQDSLITSGKEKVFLLIGTLPLRAGCDMACMEFTNVENMVYYLMSPVGRASYPYLDSCLEDASYDNYDSSFSADGDVSSLCDHDTSDVCSSVSSAPCVKWRGNVCIWDFDHMDGSVESICGRPMVGMDSMSVFDVYDDDEGVALIGDMIMSDMPVWDVENSQEEEPYVDMDAFMAMNADKAEEEICVMESECEEVESSMWEAMDASNASPHGSQDLKEVADVDDWLPGAFPICVWLPMDRRIVVDRDSSCDDSSSYDMVDDMHVGDAHVTPLLVLDAIDEADLVAPKYAMSLDAFKNDALGVVMDDAKEENYHVLLSCMIRKIAMDYAMQEARLCLFCRAFYMAMCVCIAHVLSTSPVGDCFLDEEAHDWGFDEPNVEMNDEMKMNVIKAMTRIDAMRDAKKNGRDGSAFDASNGVPMDGFESLFDKYEVDFGPVYDVDHAFEDMVDGYKPFLFDPGGRHAVYLPVNWATLKLVGLQMCKKPKSSNVQADGRMVLHVFDVLV